MFALSRGGGASVARHARNFQGSPIFALWATSSFISLKQTDEPHSDGTKKSKSDGKKPLPVQPDNDEKRVLDMLDEMPDSQPGSKKYKPALKKLEYCITRTKH